MTSRQAPAPVPVLEIGGTHVTAALIDADAGEVRRGSQSRAALPAHGSAAEIVEVLLGRAAALGAPAGARWAAAVPGPFDYEHGIALYEGVGKFESLYGLDLRRALVEGIAARPASVEFLNDADAFLLGEWRFGAARGRARCAGITLGTGVGSAFLVDGAILADGPDVPPEGRVDLLRFDGRPIEDTVSRRAIRATYAARTGAPGGSSGGPDVADIARAARAGDADAALTLRHAFEALGRTLAPWLAGFGAEALVVGGAMTGSWDLVEPALAAGLTAGGAGVRPVVAARPEAAALLGAAHAVHRGEGACQ